MFESGKSAQEIITEKGLRQESDSQVISKIISQVIAENPDQIQSYLDGNVKVLRWFFGQIMRAAKGQANPQIVQQELNKQINALRNERNDEL